MGGLGSDFDEFGLNLRKKISTVKMSLNMLLN